MAERQIKHVADHEALRHILGGQGPLCLQVVPILNLSHATGARSLKPGGERVRGSEELCVGIGHQHGSTASEAPHDGCLQGVVVAAAATLPVEVQARVLREQPSKLTLRKVSRCQTSRKSRAEGIVCRGDDLSNRGLQALSSLRSSRRNEAIWDLVYVRVELRQVNAVGACVGYIGEETRGKLALKIFKFHCCTDPFFWTVNPVAENFAKRERIPT